VARAAQIYNSKSGTETPMGVCRCKGGPAHCPGCEAIPIYRTFSKPRGIDGRPGQVGDSAQESLGRGVTGPEGRGVITVIHRNGERIRYNKRYKLQLVNFDLEDENGDGIFEPGEHIFVRRIVLKNVGGMPSPNCRIPCTFEEADMLIPVDNEEGQAYLPTSVPAGHSATSEDSAKILISTPDIDPRSHQPYTVTENIALRATVPWLDSQLSNFDVKKSVTIQYPLEVRNGKGLESVANGTTTEVSWQVSSSRLQRLF